MSDAIQVDQTQPLPPKYEDVNVLADASSGAFDLELPSPSIDLDITVKKTDSTSNAITLTTPTGTIDGSSTMSLGTQYAERRIVSDGSDYYTNATISADELSGNHDTLVDTSDDLVSVLSNATDGETIQLTSGERTIDDWADIDGVDDVKVRGMGRYQTTVKVADGANVGGFRLGNSSATNNCSVKHVGVDGNKDNQTSGTDHHAFLVESNATDCSVEHVFATDLHPYHSHNDGGSGAVVNSGATDTHIRHVRVDNTGDRGAAIFASDSTIEHLYTTNGFDRTLSIQECNDVVARHIYGRDNVEGSIVGIQHGSGTATGIVVEDVTGRGSHRTLVRVKSGVGDAHLRDLNGIKETNISGTYQGLYVESGSSGVKFDGVRVEDYDGDGILIQGDGDCEVTDATVVNPTLDGINIGRNGTSGDNHTVSGATIYDAGEDGLNLAGGSSHDVSDVIVNTCTTHGVSVTAGTDHSLANLTTRDTGGAGVRMGGGSDHDIDGATIRTTDGNGFSVPTSTGVTASDVSVKGYGADGSGTGFYVGTDGNSFSSIRVYNNANGAIFSEAGDDNHYRDLWSDTGSWRGAASGPNSTYRDTTPREINEFLDQSDGDSDGTITVSLHKPVANKVPVRIIDGFADINDWTWQDTDTDGNFEELDLSVTSGASGISVQVST